MFYSKRNIVEPQSAPVFLNAGSIFPLGDIRADEALKNSDIFTGINIIAGDIAQSGLIHQVGGRENKRVLEILSKNPTPTMSAYTFYYALIAQLIMYGNSYAIIHRNGDGIFTHLEYCQPQHVSMLRDTDTGAIAYDVIRDHAKGENEQILAKDMLHLKIGSLDGLLGRTPLASLKTEVSMLDSGNKLLASFFAKGIQAGGILKLKNGSVNNSIKREIKQSFEEVNAGSANANSVIVLDESQEFEQYTLNTDILKMIQSNEFSSKQIAKVLGIPLNRFGMELVNSTDEGANKIYISSTLAMYERVLCDELKKLDIDLQLDFSALLYDAMDDRMKRLMDGKSEGVNALTVDEVRAYYGYGEIGGDIGQTLYGVLTKKDGNARKESEGGATDE